MFHHTPWHFWPVLTIAFVWHLVGVIDYTATQFELEFWMQMATTRQDAAEIEGTAPEGLRLCIEGAPHLWPATIAEMSALAGHARCTILLRNPVYRPMSTDG